MSNFSADCLFSHPVAIALERLNKSFREANHLPPMEEIPWRVPEKIDENPMHSSSIYSPDEQISNLLVQKQLEMDLQMSPEPLSYDEESLMCLEKLVRGKNQGALPIPQPEEKKKLHEAADQADKDDPPKRSKTSEETRKDKKSEKGKRDEDLKKEKKPENVTKEDHNRDDKRKRDEHSGQDNRHKRLDDKEDKKKEVRHEVRLDSHLASHADPRRRIDSPPRRIRFPPAKHSTALKIRPWNPPRQ